MTGNPVKKIRVHIIDDSASVRMVLTELLTADPEIEVIDASSDPIIARRKLENSWPDLFILDIEMPHMDGLTFLRELMDARPTPVVICSSLTRDNAEMTMQALSAGAVNVISKPNVGIKDFLYESAIEIVDAVKSAAQAKVKKFGRFEKTGPGPVYMAEDAAEIKASAPVTAGDKAIVAIGASAGGTTAVEVVLKELSADTAAIVIVQHMPEKFTRAYADRLNGICAMRVEEAADGMPVSAGTALIAPGNLHLQVARKGSGYAAVVKEGPRVNRHRPSVDVLFRSVAGIAGGSALGIILTGMGDDGAAGMLEMHRAGAYTVAQDEDTSVVYGMPREALRRGGVDRVVPLGEIPSIIGRFARGELGK